MLMRVAVLYRCPLASSRIMNMPFPSSMMVMRMSMSTAAAVKSVVSRAGSSREKCGRQTVLELDFLSHDLQKKNTQSRPVSLYEDTTTKVTDPVVRGVGWSFGCYPLNTSHVSRN